MATNFQKTLEKELDPKTNPCLLVVRKCPRCGYIPTLLENPDITSPFIPKAKYQIKCCGLETKICDSTKEVETEWNSVVERIDEAESTSSSKHRVTLRVETGECAGAVITVTLNNRASNGWPDRKAVELLSKLDFCSEFPERKDYKGSFAKVVSVEEVKE